MKLKTLKVFAITALSTVSALSAQTFDLDFGNHNATTNQAPPNGTIGDPYTTSSIITFTDVAPTSGVDLDLRVTVTSWGPRYSYLGSFPDYKHTNNAIQPNGDLGYLYQYNGGSNVGANDPARLGGVNYTLEFLEGGTDNAFVVPDFRLLIYDVDGETAQSESVRTFRSDGFYGYRIPESGGVAVAAEPNVDGAVSYLFTGPGADVAEDNPSGAFVLYFQNTSSITLQMQSRTTTGTGANGVFSAIDGDLSLVGGNLDAFEDIVVVPEPSTVALALLGLGAGALRTRRRRA